jgi:hypothetical protein
VDDPGDSVVENSGEGTDTVTSTLASYALPANVENLNLGSHYGDTSPLNGTGNGLANTLRGNSGSNLLDGGAGNDTLIGGNGNDRLTGGTGNDTFVISIDDTGTDTITDLAVGDVIQVAGAGMNGPVTAGTGMAVGSGEVQAATSGGQTTLYIGIDANPGADVRIVLDGAFAASNFSVRGYEIFYDINHAPTANVPIVDQQVTENAAFSFHVPASAFSDADGDPLACTVQAYDIDWGFLALPAWLHYDAISSTLSGTPAHADIGSLMLLVTATDTHGATADPVFDLAVRAAPVAPPPPPTVSFSDDIPGVATGPVNYLLSFNEPVSGLTADDFVVGNGSVGSVTGSGASYVVSVLPAANVEGTQSLTLKAGAVTGLGGVSNAASMVASQMLDTRAPAVIDQSAQHVAGGVAPTDDLVFLFGEAIQRGNGTVWLKDAGGSIVETFDAATSARLSVAGSVLAVDPTAALAFGSGYSVEFGPGAVRDLAGNGNAAPAGYAFTTRQAPDTTPPTLALSCGKTSLATGGSATIGITLSENSTNFGVDDLSVTGGTLSGFSGSGRSYSATFTPAADSALVAVISVGNGRFTDAAGNANADGGDADNTVRLGIDTQAPVVLSYSPDKDASQAPVAGDIVLGFSEAVQRGTGLISLKTAGGDVVETFDAAASGHLAVSGSTLTIHPTLDLLPGMAYLLDLPRGALADLAGNAWAGTSAYRFETAVNAVSGTPLADVLVGSPGRDRIAAFDGKDVLDGGAGNDSLDGGAGIDTAVFHGPRAAAKVTAGAGIVADALGVESAIDGVDTLSGIERLQFSDMGLAFDLSGHAGSVAEVIGAVFGTSRLGNKAYVGLGLDLLDKGMSMADLVALAVQSDAFLQLAGSPGHAEFVKLVFGNVMGMAPSQAELDYFVDLLDSGRATPASLALMASESVANQVHVDLVGLAATGLEYLPVGGG